MWILLIEGIEGKMCLSKAEIKVYPDILTETLLHTDQSEMEDGINSPIFIMMDDSLRIWYHIVAQRLFCPR